MKQAFLLTLLFIGVTFSANAQDETYEQTLGKMIAVSGGDETYKVAIEQMLGMFKQQNQGMADDFWNSLQTEMMDKSVDELVKMLVPVYQKHLTQQDLKDIIAFYETPIGKKYAASMAPITKGSMQVGQQWGMQVSQQVMQKIKDSKK